METVELLCSSRKATINTPSSYNDLRQQVYRTYGIKSGDLKYYDEENDLISICSQEDYQKAISGSKTIQILILQEFNRLSSIISEDENEYSDESLLLQSGKVKVDFACQYNQVENVHIVIKTIRDALSNELGNKLNRNSFIHSGIVVRHIVTCVLCGNYPIIGIRYKCSTCALELCEECEFKAEHKHPMYKITRREKDSEAKHQVDIDKSGAIRARSTGKQIRNNVEMLQSIGFTNDGTILKAVIESNGDLEKAVELLSS